jgi:polyhydroxyalkanoate synthase subunit PhaC
MAVPSRSVPRGHIAYFDRPGGQIGLMAGSRAGSQIWPDIAASMAERSAA